MKFVTKTIDNTKGQYPEYPRKILTAKVEKYAFDNYCVNEEGEAIIDEVLNYADEVQ